MKLLVVVNESPWQTGLALLAHRFAQQAVRSGASISAVFFREDGVYNALAAEANDAGTPDLEKAWREMAIKADTRLLLCSSSRLRRFKTLPPGPFEETGLTEMVELMLLSDRVVTF